MAADYDADDDGPAQDEVRRKLLKPLVSADEALSVLLDAYCVADDGPDGGTGAADSDRAPPRAEVVRALDSYDDANYLVRVGGEEHLLKVHNGVESEEYLATRARKRARRDAADHPSGGGEGEGSSGGVIGLHSSIFSHLAAPAYGVTTGTTVPPKKGSEDGSVCVRELPVVSPDHSPRRLVVRLQGWVRGTPLSDVERCPVETLADAGTRLGGLRRALDDLAASDADALRAARRYHAWDGRNLLDLKPYVSHIDDVDKRNLVSGVVDAFDRALIEGKGGEKLRMGIIHGDFNDANIIVGDDMKVSGVIDFGDTVYSWKVLDVTVAMTYALISSYGKGNRSVSAACAVLRGFHHAYPLTPDERRHLRLLCACRLALSATMGNYTHERNPENEYVLFHSAPAWEALRFVWGADGRGAGGDVGGLIDRAFEVACDDVVVPEGSRVPSCVDLSFPDPPMEDPFAPARGGIKKDDAPRGEAAAGKPVVTFVTGNQKKLEEVKRILGAGGELPFALTNHKVDLPELQGDPIAVAKQKCELAAKEVNGAVITEDTSLCFNALNGMPGVYVKWFLESCGLAGLNDMISFSEDKSGYAQTVVAFSEGPGKECATLVGRTDGRIVRPRGGRDFGWDPIFEPDEGNGRTYAEMTGEEKDGVSHRKRAFAKLRDYLAKKYSA